jgi:hypothetical protein
LSLFPYCIWKLNLAPFYPRKLCFIFQTLTNDSLCFVDVDFLNSLEGLDGRQLLDAM